MQAIADPYPHGGADVEALESSIKAHYDFNPFSEVITASLDASMGVGVRVFSGGELLGYVYSVANPDGRTATVEVIAAPEDVAPVLAVAQPALGESELLLWLHGPGSPGAGWAVDRALLRMVAPLPAPDAYEQVSGFTIREFEPGDEAALLAVNNAAFAGHPEQGGWSLEDLSTRFAYPWFEPDGLRMLWSDDQLAAFHWTKQHGGGLGEVFVLAVDPAFHGRGLGRVITAEGLRYLGEQGCSTVQLYVDAASGAAVALYESFGFLTTESHRSFRRV